jgi:PEP-CTERM motif
VRTITLALLLLFPMTGYATTVTLDPGPTGSSFNYQYFDFSTFAGTPLAGQNLSLDIRFTSAAFLVDRALTMELFLNQTGPLGTNPTAGYAMSGYLIGRDGNPLVNNAAFLKNVEMPAQIFPGWPFTTPGGDPLLPATVGFGAQVDGFIVDDIPGPDYSIAPVVFSGVHFDITLPNSPGNSLIGSRFELANFDSPILISPDPLPRYAVHIPEPSSLFTLAVGLVFFAARKQLLIRRKLTSSRKQASRVA